MPRHSLCYRLDLHSSYQQLSVFRIQTDPADTECVDGSATSYSKPFTSTPWKKLVPKNIKFSQHFSATPWSILFLQIEERDKTNQIILELLS